MKRLAATLQEATPKGPLSVGVVSGDAEASSLAAQFLRALHEAGWDATPVNMLGPAGTGAAFIRKGSESPPYLTALVTAFGAGGLGMAVQEDSNLSQSSDRQVILVVLSKP